jgi:hypothetical protein
MATKSLKARKSALSKTEKQLEVLSNSIFKTGILPTFKQKLQAHHIEEIKPSPLQILPNQHGVYVQSSVRPLSCGCRVPTEKK